MSDEPRPVRLLTWNLQRASAARAHEQAAWLLRSEADLLVLTEVFPAGGSVVSDALTEAGYLVHAEWPQRNEPLVLLAARALTLTPQKPLAAAFASRTPTAIAELPSGPLVRITGLYIPSRGPRAERNQLKRAVQHAATCGLDAPERTVSAQAVDLLAGDLNVVERDHTPFLKVYGEWEYRFYESFAERGFVDAYRAAHPLQRDHSWYGRSGRGYRLDHAFLTGGQVLSAEYDHCARAVGLSDHAALLVSFTPTPNLHEATYITTQAAESSTPCPA